MKNIAFRENLRPYSRWPGAKCIVPCSDWTLEVFPTLLRLNNGLDIPLALKGPITSFLVQMDLERDCVTISGKALDGYYRFEIKAEREGLFLRVYRAPEGNIQVGGKKASLKDKLLLAEGGKICPKGIYERLSLGNWKAQDWDLVRKRQDVREILPPLFLLGQKIPTSESVDGDIGALLEKNWPLFFQAAFSGMLVPHLEDPLHQGILPSQKGVGTPLAVLVLAYKKIRSQLIREEGTTLSILPSIQEYSVGRAHLRTRFGLVHLEWTQGMIRKMIVEAVEDCSIQFVFAKDVASFRVLGQKALNESFVACTAKTKILFDRFQR